MAVKHTSDRHWFSKRKLFCHTGQFNMVWKLFMKTTEMHHQFPGFSKWKRKKYSRIDSFLWSIFMDQKMIKITRQPLASKRRVMSTVTSLWVWVPHSWRFGDLLRSTRWFRLAITYSNNLEFKCENHIFILPYGKRKIPEMSIYKSLG